MLVTTENLAEMLEVNPNTILNWELNLSLNIRTDGEDVEKYSDELITFFKKVKSLVLNGYTLAAIKDFLYPEIEYQNQIQKSVDSFIVEDINPKNTPQEPDTVNLVNDYIFNVSPENNLSREEKITSFTEILINNKTDKNESGVLFETLLKDLKQYTERAMDAEKKVFLLEDTENRLKQENSDLSSELEQVKAQLEEKEQKLKQYESQKKRLNLMEVQLKILQLQKNKKKAWEVWK